MFGHPVLIYCYIWAYAAICRAVVTDRAGIFHIIYCITKKFQLLDASGVRTSRVFCRRTFPVLRPICGWDVTTLWVKCSQWVNQPGQLSLPSVRRRRISNLHGSLRWRPLITAVGCMVTRNEVRERGLGLLRSRLNAGHVLDDSSDDGSICANMATIRVQVATNGTLLCTP